jgi:hypothetical protein
MERLHVTLTAKFGVHYNHEIHIGDIMTLEKRFFQSKQKI